MSFTIVPLHHLSLDNGTSIPFGDGFALQDVPEWLRNEPILKDIGYNQLQWMLESEHALVVEYDANAIGELDATWKGKDPKSIQAVKEEIAVLANLALWLIHPTHVCFTNIFHAISHPIPGEGKRPIVQLVETHSPLLVHPSDVGNVIAQNEVTKAGQIHQVLCSIPRDNAVWTALRATWVALTMNSADLRYACFWMGIEALLGAEDNTGEVAFKLSQRAALFLADSPERAREVFRKAKKCYGMRSKIIHGRWKHDPKIDEVMADTETIIRTVLLRLLDDPKLLNTFTTEQRDRFLEDIVFSNATSVLTSSDAASLMDQI